MFNISTLKKFNSSSELFENGDTKINDDVSTADIIFKSPRDIIGNADPVIVRKKILSTFLNNKLLYVNNNNIHKIQYTISISNKLKDKVEVYLLAQKNTHIVRNIEEDSYVCNYHSVIMYRMKTTECDKLIGYILFSLDEDKIYVYDLFVIEKYKLSIESFDINDDDSGKTLFNRLLTEFDSFVNFCNVKVVVNPIIGFPRIKKLINNY